MSERKSIHINHGTSSETRTVPSTGTVGDLLREFENGNRYTAIVGGSERDVSYNLSEGETVTLVPKSPKVG